MRHWLGPGLGRVRPPPRLSNLRGRVTMGPTRPMSMALITIKPQEPAHLAIGAAPLAITNVSKFQVRKARGGC